MMVRKILIAIAVILIVAAGLLAYSFFRVPEEASGPIEAIPLDLNDNQPTEAAAGAETVSPAETVTEPEPLEADIAATEELDPTPQIEVEVEPIATTETQAQTTEEIDPTVELDTQTETNSTTGAEEEAIVVTETPAETSSEAGEVTGEAIAPTPIIFEIVQDESEARFLIDEVLLGNPKTAVGVTNQVAGQFAVSPADLSAVQVGIIQVNARTLATDNQNRNRAIKNFILRTDNYEFITFTPTEVVGLPERGEIGETYTLQIVGDLMVTDVTRQVTFDVTATPTSETRIMSTASTAFLYTDFELLIPDSRSVDTVDDEVRLEIDFVAEAISPPDPTESEEPLEASAAITPILQEYPIPSGSRPHDVAPAPDGGVWYTAQGSGELGRLDPETGETHHIALGAGSAPHGVIVGPDGAPWITDGGLNAIVRVDPTTEEVQSFPLPAGSGYANLNTATFASDGVLWFTGQSGIYGRLDPQIGQVEIFEAPQGRGPYGISTSPDGAVYYASLAGSYVGLLDLNTAGATVLELPTPGQGARRVWPDSQGRVWVSEWNAGQVAVYDPATGEWREWRLPGANPRAYAVYVDEQDMVWLSDFGANALVRFDPIEETFEVFSLPSPGANVRQILGRPGEVWGAESGTDKLVVIRTS
jgi:virginiamycin B lyase